MNKREVGSKYESIAADYLIKQGYQILEQNFTTRMGEIDLIAKDDEYLVFVEVKYRSSIRNGTPEEAITYYKKRQITNVARYYMMKHNLSEYTPCRFDVVVILQDEIKLVQNAFDAVS